MKAWARLQRFLQHLQVTCDIIHEPVSFWTKDVSEAIKPVKVRCEEVESASIYAFTWKYVGLVVIDDLRYDSLCVIVDGQVNFVANDVESCSHLLALLYDPVISQKPHSGYNDDQIKV